MNRFRSDRGDAAGSMVFALLAVILIGAVVTTTVSLINQTSSMSAVQAMNTAADQRFDQYIHQVRANQPTDNTKHCFTAQATCVTVDDSVAPVGGVLTLKLTATRGSQTRTYTKTTKTGVAQSIVGFDSAGQPVWG